MPLVSVCIVTFNHEKYIYDCISSVILQTSKVSLEILIGDDCSEDKTTKIIEDMAKKHPDLIKHYRHTNRLGSGAKNYQFLIKKATGQFIAHLDGDDYWLPGKLFEQVRFLEQYPECSAVYTNAIAIHDNGSFLGLFNNNIPELLNINEIFRRGNFLNHSSMLYRCHLKENILEMKIPFLDYRIHLAHARCGLIGYLNKPYVAYRVGSSTSILAHANNRTRQLYWEAISDISQSTLGTGILAEGMAEFMRSVIFHSIKVKNIKLFLKWMPIVLSASPVNKLKMVLLIAFSIFRTGLQELILIYQLRLSKKSGIAPILYRR